MSLPLSQEIVAGALAVPRAVVFLLGHPRSRGAALLPGLVHGTVLLAAGIVGIFLIDDVTARLLPAAPTVPGLLQTVERVAASVALAAGTLAVALLGGVVVVLVLAGPLYERLAAIVQQEERGTLDSDPASTFASVSADVGRALVSVSQVLAIALLVQVPLAAATFVPILNLLAFPLLFLWTSFFLAVAASEPHLDRQRLTFLQKVRSARTRWPALLALGAVQMVLSLIPLLNLLLGPLFVTAATRLWLAGGYPAADARPLRDGPPLDRPGRP